MKKRLTNILEFRKRWWIPTVFAATLALVAFLLPMLLGAVLGIVLQGVYLVGFMAIQVFAWFGIFFYYLGGRIRMSKIMPGDLKLSWDDYRGQPELVRKSKAWVKYLTGVQTFEEMGGVHQTGLLMEGPPGSGKTYLAKCMAAEAGIPFFSVEASSLTATFIGIAPLKVGRIFNDCRNKAREYGGCILFIDEIDAIGGHRGGVMGPGPQAVEPMGMYPMMGMGSQVINTLLTEIDGFHDKRPRWWRLANRLKKFFTGEEMDWETPRLMVIAATNRPDMLDPALTRPGRLGRRLLVDVPDLQGATDIAQYYLNKIKHDDYLTPERVAMTAAGQPAAFIKEALNRAVMLAHLDDEQDVHFRHWQRALAEERMGDKQPLPLSAEERRCLAYHEAGHAVALLACAGDRLKPVYLSTERHGRAYGFMFPVEYVRWQIGRTETMIHAAIMMFMAGMAAEVVFLGERHNSGGGDLPGIKALLNQLLYGAFMDIWPWEDEKHGGKLQERRRRWLWDQTLEVLKQNGEAVETLVDALMQEKELTEDRIMKLVDGKIVRYETPEYEYEEQEDEEKVD